MEERKDICEGYERDSVQQLDKLAKDKNERFPIYPLTYIQAVYDARTKERLDSILWKCNNVYLPWMGSAGDTRIQLPFWMRRMGIIITYKNLDDETITEKLTYDLCIADDFFRLDSSWTRITDALPVGGNITIGSNGNWFQDGVDTGFKAQGPKGDNGLTPMLRTVNNKLQYSYDGEVWNEISEYIAAWFRYQDNKIQISRDQKTWSDLSKPFTQDLYIKGYVATSSALPSTGVKQGDIYMVGPTYAAEDTEHKNPIYRMYVYNDSGWVDNGVFQSIAAGVVQTIGNSETEVMSQKAVSSIVGLDTYPVFSDTKPYVKGEIVNYGGLLYEFTADHEAGAWIGTDARETSLREEAKNKDIRLNSLFEYISPEKLEFDYKECMLLLNIINLNGKTNRYWVLQQGWVQNPEVVQPFPCFLFEDVDDPSNLIEVYFRDITTKPNNTQYYEWYSDDKSIKIEILFDWAKYNTLFSTYYPGNRKRIIVTSKPIDYNTVQNPIEIKFNSTSTYHLPEYKINRCIKHLSICDFDTTNDIEEWSLLRAGFLTNNSSNQIVFYFLRKKDNKQISYNSEKLESIPTGICFYEFYLNSTHVKILFDWDKYTEYFTNRYAPLNDDKLYITAYKGNKNQITSKGFLNSSVVTENNINIAKCYYNLRLYEYKYSGETYELRQQGWADSIGYPVFYYIKEGAPLEDMQMFNEIDVTQRPSGILHYVLDNKNIRVEFDFDWDSFFKYFPNDIYRYSEKNAIKINPIEFEYARKTDLILPYIEDVSLGQEDSGLAIYEYFRSLYVIFNKPVKYNSILNKLKIGVNRNYWTTEPEKVKINIVVGQFDQRQTLVNPRIYTFNFKELSPNYINDNETEFDFYDKNVVINKGEIVGIRSGNTAAGDDFIFLVSKSEKYSDYVYASSTIDGVFVATNQFTTFQYSVVEFDTNLATQASVEALQTSVNVLINNEAKSSNILTDTVTGEKYKIQVANGELTLKSLKYKRILLIGTSQTHHDPSESVGWYVNRAMAGSIDNNVLPSYLLRGIQKTSPDATISIMNDYSWQRNYVNFDYSVFDSTIESVNPDIIFLVTAGNSTYSEELEPSAEEYLDYLKSKAPGADIYTLVGWYGQQKANAITEASLKKGAIPVNVSANYNSLNTWLVGDYYYGNNTYYPIVNEGVATHPNDMGHMLNANQLLNACYADNNESEIYNITINITGAGKITTPNNRWVKEGIVTLRVVSGTISEITGQTKNGSTVSLVSRTNDVNSNWSNYYTFIMPNEDVIINCVFK